MGWIEFFVAMALFIGSHRIPAALGVKDPLVARLGTAGYTVLFSLGSTVLLLWVIWAAGRAPLVPIWDQSQISRWGVNLVLPVVVALAVFGVAAPNPFAFEGRAKGFDPDRPGIVGLTRQPLLWALALWSLSHLWANGDLAHIILFGFFAGFSLIGMRMVETRRKAAIGHAKWQEYAAHTALFPGAALVLGAWRPCAAPSLIRLGLCILVWVSLVSLHVPVIGVSPLP